MTTRRDWTRLEVELIVDDYLAMLRSELDGIPYNKAEHRRALRPRLDGRSEAAIEFKHCNISAILRDSDRPYIAGYQPRSNAQDILGEVIDERYRNSFGDEIGDATGDQATWISHVASCVSELPTEFRLPQVYEYESSLAELHPENNNVRAKIRQVLQRLAQAEAVTFTDFEGNYRKTSTFPSGIPLVSIDASLSVDPFELAGDVPDDPGDRYLRSVKLRRGAPRFRRALITLYGNRCAVTDGGPEEVLEAAHVEPHFVNGRNSIDNGILMRADIHTLFDLHLLSIEPRSMRVRLSGRLHGTSYEKLDGQKLRPRIDGTHPARNYLNDHYERLKK